MTLGFYDKSEASVIRAFANFYYCVVSKSHKKYYYSCNGNNPLRKGNKTKDYLFQKATRERVGPAIGLLATFR